MFLHSVFFIIFVLSTVKLNFCIITTGVSTPVFLCVYDKKHYKVIHIVIFVFCFIITFTETN